jgi:hypothetical protein
VVIPAVVIRALPELKLSDTNVVILPVVVFSVLILPVMIFALVIFDWNIVTLSNAKPAMLAFVTFN